MIPNSRPYLWILLYTIACCLFTLGLQGQPCNPPFIQTANANTFSIQLSWNSVANALNYQIELTRLTPTTAAAQIFTVDQSTWTIVDLEPATQYRVRVRTVCANSTSTWSPPRIVTTYYRNGQHCDVNLPINLNSCSNPQLLQIVVDESGNLGDDVEFMGIKLLVTHPRVSDLTFKLKTPSGKELTLFSNYNTLGSNVGNINQAQCQDPLFISATSCTILTVPGIPLRGEVGPFETFDNLRDGSDINGIWTLIYCDNSPIDQGAIQFVELVFSNNTCMAPSSLITGEIGPDFLSVKSKSRVFCDSVIYEVVPSGSLPGTGPNKGANENILAIQTCEESPFIISGLEPGITYELYARTKCDENIYSSNTCGITFTTLCDFPALKSGFDNAADCPESCDIACTIDQIWNNLNTDGLQWIVSTGATPTPFTGPLGGLYGDGKYIYIPTSNETCIAGGAAILESQCLKLGTIDEGCSMQFGLHQFGNQIEFLLLEAIYGDGTNKDTLLLRNGNQNENWVIHKLDLSPYENQVIQLRFTGLSSGPRGNIALDEILFFGDISLTNTTYTYYQDADSDGFGDPNESISSCFAIPPPGYVANNTDCNDQDASINPGANEIPCNLKDDNCSGVIDDIEADIVIGNILITPAQCVGAMDGKIQIDHITGGLPPYLVEWSTNSEGLIIENVASGYYNVTVSDQAGCTLIVDSIEVTAPQLISLDQYHVFPATCEGKPDGIISLNVSGPFEVLFVIWEDGVISSERSDLSPGNYQATISDGAACTLELADLVVGSQNLLNIEVLEVQNPRCHGQSTGQIRIRVDSDPTHIFYQWSNGDEGPTARTLIAGTYSVTITDTLTQCVGIREFTLTEPSPMELTVSALDPVTCPASSDGRINIHPSGGTPGYRYAWSNGQIQRFTRNLINIPSGFYQLTLTDNANCVQVFEPIHVMSPPPITILSSEIVHNRCPSSTNGSITLEIEGGTPEYLFLWSNGAGGSFIEQIPNGNYNVTVTDELQCRRIFTGINVQSANLPLDYNISEIVSNKCFNDREGLISISIEAGAALPIEFHWSNGRIIQKNILGDSLVNLATGNYNVTITDAEGCNRIISNIPIIGPSTPINYSINEVRHVSCYGKNDGLIAVDPTGGTPPFRVQWQDGTANNVYQNLGPGDYTFTIIDANDCSVEPPAIVLNEPDSLEIIINILNENCTNDNGRINSIAFGGTAPYNYNWTFNNFEFTGPDLDQLSCGRYELQVMDFNGCTLIQSVQLGTVSTVENYKQNNINVYPNPVKDFLVVEYDIASGVSNNARIIIYNALGKIVVNQRVGSNVTVVELPKHLSSGMLFLQLIEGEKIITHKVMKH